MDEFMKLLVAYEAALEKQEQWPGVRSYGMARYHARQAMIAHVRGMEMDKDIKEKAQPDAE